MKDDTVEYLRSAAERLAIRVVASAGFADSHDVLFHCGYSGRQVGGLEDAGLLDYYAVHLILHEGARADVMVDDAFPNWDDEL